MVLPNLIVVGAAKSGTTSLWHYLMSHPEIFMSEIKETNFFSHQLMTRNNPIKDLENYESLFENKENYKIRGEVSNSYLTFADKVAPRIKELIPDCRILIILRHPVERLYSRYWHAVRDQYWKDTFSKYSETSKSTEIISDKIQTYVNIFGQKSVRIVFLEEYNKNLDIFYEGLFSFLGVKKTNLPNSHLNKSGKTKWKFLNDFVLNGPSIVRMPAKILPPKYRANLREYLKMLNTDLKPEIDSVVQRQLLKYYKDEIANIKSIAGRLPESWER